MSMRDTVLNEMRAVAGLHGKRLRELTDDLPLSESGLDSLCFALLVARLEDILDRDPLSETPNARFPRTVGEFVALYEEAVA
jgi:Phosphopantetheine attachment site